MLLDFVDLEIAWHTKSFGKIFYINKINKHLIFWDIKLPGEGGKENQFGTQFRNT